MFKGVRAEFYAASSREPNVYRGRPFLIEAAIAFGGELSADESSRVIRFANRVPLLFQQSACSSFKAVTETNWRNYDLQHPRGGLPIGPLVIMIHMASVWVPFTSESKEAIADYDEVRKEMKLALMECGRKLGTYLRKRAKMKREGERRDVFERYIGEIASAIHAINATDAKRLYEALLTQAKKRTAVADLQLDDEGRKVADEDPADQDGVLIIDAPAVSGTGIAPAPANTAGGTGVPPVRAGRRSASPTDDPPASKPTKAQAAALKVAAMAKHDDDQPALMDVKPTKPTTPTKPTKASAAKPATAPPKPSPKAEPKPPARTPKLTPSTKPAPSTKPKMRLVNGKLVPIDDSPRLF
jgi:DNA topoisomerase-6 subunit B